MATAYVTHSDCSRHDTGWAHPEHQGRLAAIARAVYRDMLTLVEVLREVEAVPAREADLLLGHDPAYLSRVRGAVDEAARTGVVLPFEGEVRVSGASWDAACAAVGAGVTAVDAVLAGEVGSAFCAVRPPGHQAGISSAGGFSLFNTVAIAARHARERRGLDRVLIVEWGAAAGRGTAEIVTDDPGIRFASVHQRSDREPVWPDGTAIAAVPAGADGERVGSALETVLGTVTADFSPDLVLVSLGLDALATDPVGELAVTPLDVFALTRTLVALSSELCGGRLVTVLEGGYDAPAAGGAVVQHLRALTGLDPA